jgi:hypothetical protein
MHFTSEFNTSNHPSNLVFETVANSSSNDGCPGEISQADFNGTVLMQQMHGEEYENRTMMCPYMCTVT